ncbi:MAG: hypothetical protein HYZ38_17470 [Mycobacterium sp.]|nr:hypothetical protein [Mycobacterium sp.]
MASKHLIRRAVVVGSFAVAVVAAPAVAALSAPEAGTQAEGRCLAWIGTSINGKCISWSMSGGSQSVLNGVPVTVNGPVADVSQGHNGSFN